MEEIEFTKYKTRGEGYHWEQNSLHPIKMNAFVKARYRKCVDLLTEEMGSLNEKKIADLGCGDGVLTYEIGKRGAESVGVDLSEEAIGFARRKCRSLGVETNFYIESCTKTHFSDSSLDAVVSSDVIEHLSNPFELLSEIQRILKPGGIAIISTPIRITEYPLDKMHVYEWYPDEFSLFIKKVFPDVMFKYSHPVFWYELITKNTIFRILTNILSYFKNPFLKTDAWRYPCLQYAIIHKEGDL